MYMRFLGNKESLLGDIEKLLSEKNLLNSNLAFFDAFCGTGTVADYFKKYYKIIINDNLKWATIYAAGKITSKNCDFKKLGFNPIEYLNQQKSAEKGFIYNNYSPAASSRMYFTPENAGRIDFFRSQIEKWKNEDAINHDEYNYLLSCLIESVSKVSNTAGVYGAFLKNWDPRALKEIEFIEPEHSDSECSFLEVHNDKIEKIINEVDCDILYLDPPYTQNQYGTQYHLLETLVLNDNPPLSKITGSRPTAPMRSDWSKNYKAHILFDKVLAETKAKYILFSYNNDGFMSKTFIEAALKRYGKQETFICKKIPYKKYQNWKSQNENEHFEYLFFIEKKPLEQVVYESPLNYIGSKAKVVGNIKSELEPKLSKSTEFVDAFGGGFNVGINIGTKNTVYNDNNFLVADLIESFKKYDTYEYILYVKKIIEKFKLEKSDAQSYNSVRSFYNSLPMEKRDPRLLFTIILYSYQQQIRFNSRLEFNNPVGMRWFNDKILEKMISFSRKLKEENCKFLHGSYKEIPLENGDKLFFYMDPPYSLTTGAYNDGKRGFLGWNKSMEKELFDFSDSLSSKGIPFMLSYVMEHKGKCNEELKNWIDKNHYRIIELGDIIGISGSKRKEILVTNYEAV